MGPAMYWAISIAPRFSRKVVMPVGSLALHEPGRKNDRALSGTPEPGWRSAVPLGVAEPARIHSITAQQGVRPTDPTQIGEMPVDLGI